MTLSPAECVRIAAERRGFCLPLDLYEAMAEAALRAPERVYEETLVVYEGAVEEMKDYLLRQGAAALFMKMLDHGYLPAGPVELAVRTEPGDFFSRDVVHVKITMAGRRFTRVKAADR